MVTGCSVKFADLPLFSLVSPFGEDQGDVGRGRAGPELKVGSALKELSAWGWREGKAHSRSGIRAVDLPGAQDRGGTHQPWDQAGCPPGLLREEAESLELF